VEVSLELAQTLEAAGKIEDASHAYTELLASPSVSVAARAKAGQFLARQGDYKQAETQGDAILAVESDSAAGHYLRGEGLLAQGNLETARRELALAVDADPESQYLDAQGRASEKSASVDSKYLDLALRAYERASAQDPKLLNSWAGQGRVHVARKEWDQAITPLVAANKLAPNDADVLFMLGLCAAKLAQTPADKKRAIQYFAKSISVKPNPDASYQLGLLYLDLNDAGSAIGAFGTATSSAEQVAKQTGKPPDWLPDGYYQLGETAYGRDNATARKAWLRYLDLNPKPGAQLDEVRQHLATDLRSI
jgi:tetratricopeptide (TPR) repeat protein